MSASSETTATCSIETTVWPVTRLVLLVQARSQPRVAGRPGSTTTREATMHAVLVNVKLSDNPDPTILREQVVPQVKELQGFVAGYWTRGDGVGRSIVVFDSEENAQAA